MPVQQVGELEDRCLEFFKKVKVDRNAHNGNLEKNTCETVDFKFGETLYFSSLEKHTWVLST